MISGPLWRLSACIELWLRDKDVSPLTGCVLKNKNLVVELNDIVIEHKKKNREAAAPKAPAPKADTPAGRVVAGAKEVEAIARQAKLRANKKRAKKRAEARQAGGADATGASLGPNGYHSGGGATSALKRANLENIIRVMSVGHDGEEERHDDA